MSITGCCAPSGHATAALQRAATKSRRLMSFPRAADSFTTSLLSTGHMKEPDPLCARPVEHMDRLGCRLQQDLAALSFEIGFSFRR
jgi:hypothetical protein